MRKSVRAVAVSVFVAALGWTAEADLERARALYQQTQYRAALRILEPNEPKTPPVQSLLGQCYYLLEDFKKASEAFEKAVAAAPRNSFYWDWLGRAYGKRAETSSFLTAPFYARKAREHFERAVELDPLNLEALDDLFEYYLQAPGFLGGGVEKAERLLERIRERAPARYHSMHARLSEKQEQWDAAEQHWRQAAEAAPSEVERLIDLARFLARRGQLSESDKAFERALQLAPQSAQLKFHRARTYIESSRGLDQARQLLQEYLASPLTPDDPPRADAESLLKTVTSDK